MMGQIESIPKISKEFFKNESKLTRCIILGGFQDEMPPRILKKKIFELNEKTDRIISNIYELDLVIKLDKNKELVPYNEKIKFPMKVDYDSFDIRPFSIITENGKIYQDKIDFLKFSHEFFYVERILKIFSEKYKDKNFIEIYKEISIR